MGDDNHVSYQVEGIKAVPKKIAKEIPVFDFSTNRHISSYTSAGILCLVW